MPEQPTLASEALSEFAEIFDAIVNNVSLVIQGKTEAIRLALVCVAAEGHLLVEDVPGVGKTSMAKALARSFELEWHRIQFTPDLLPSDVTGATIYDRNTGALAFRPGGVFANVVLADEINRASPKTQSALLEAMEEGQVTVDATTYSLPSPFFVIATQNPTEHEGTYPLPESQLDRFLLRARVGYPDRAAELAMLDRHAVGHPVEELKPVASPASVGTLVAVAAQVYVAPAVKEYIVDLAAATREHPALALGMSQRAALGLQRAARALAAAQQRYYVVPDDVRALLSPVLEHRLLLTSGGHRADGRVQEVIADVARNVPVPSGRTPGRD